MAGGQQAGQEAKGSSGACKELRDHQAEIRRLCGLPQPDRTDGLLKLFERVVGSSGACNPSKEKQLRELAQEMQHHSGAACYEFEGQEETDPDNCLKCRLASILSQPEPQDTELRRLDGIKVMKMEHLPAASIMVSPDVYETMKQEIARAQAPQTDYRAMADDIVTEVGCYDGEPAAQAKIMWLADYLKRKLGQPPSRGAL